jgi:MFS family permease
MTITLMCLTAIGQSVAFPNVGALISRTADPHRQGQILGLNNATGALARVVGPFCAGLAFSEITIDGPFFLGAMVVAPAILLALAADIQAAILKKLSMFVLRSKVKLADAGEGLVLLGLAGRRALTKRK